MESHAEAQVKNSRAVRYDAGHLLQEAPLVTDCGTLVQNKHNFNFGAEIVKTRAMATEHERNIKTNTEKTSAPTTSTLVASTCSVDECATTIETPLSVSELPPISNVDNWVEQGGAGACGGANQDRDGNGSDEDGGDENDNYQSDDDDEDEDDDNETSHQELDGRRNVDASLESDDSSTDSDFSDLSGLSDMSGREWKPISTRPINWVQKQIHAGADPRELLSQMLPTGAHQIAPGVNDMMLWRILASMLAEPPRRQKLRHVNTFEDVIQLVQQSENIIVLTGAGVSVSCGIPDFRSSDGIYSRLAKDYPDLPDPQAMFDINYFSRDPRPFFKFAREIYPGQFKPSPCHRFIKLLEQKQKLLRNYTQNIDTLEQVAGIRNVIECHGSFSTASCTKCKLKCTADAIREDIFVQRIPVCRRCQPNVEQSVDASEPVSEMELRRLVENGIMKPDIVFFGEGLPEEFHTVMASDKDKCDLLIVMGSSLKVRPVALIPSSIPAHVPQILINREQLHHLEFDVELLGDSDVIINQLCHRLGGDWKDICFNEVVLQECKELLPLEEDTITDGDGEEDGQQLLDTDTQSIKSSASTDIALRSDSGFESSTSSGMVVGKIIGATTASGEAIEAIEQIKSTILQLDSPLTKMKSPELLPPDLLDEPPEAASFEHRSFHPFSACVEQETISTMTLTASSYADNMRHLSIDSSKDSGIQCDSSNSALPCNSNIGTLPPPSTNFNVNDTIVSTQPNTSTAVAAASHELNDSSQVGGAEVQREQRKHLSAAERLVDGTYYCHESSASYVFPGAQVSWCADSEEEEEDDDDNENDFGLELDGDIDANGAPLSPLMPPSVEAEVVSEITTTSAFAICAKRHAAISSDAETLATMHNMTPGDSSSVSDDHSARLANCTPPPSKKRREMGAELEAMPKAATAATFIAHTTTSSTPTAGSSSNNFDATGTAVMATETLLQQF